MSLTNFGKDEMDKSWKTRDKLWESRDRQIMGKK